VPRDPVMGAYERAEDAKRAWLAAVERFADRGEPSLEEVMRLGAIVDELQQDILAAGEQQRL